MHTLVWYDGVWFTISNWGMYEDRVESDASFVALPSDTVQNNIINIGTA